MLCIDLRQLESGFRDKYAPNEARSIRGMHSNNDRQVTLDDLRHAGWMIRHYSRNQLLREQWIQKLGALSHQAFNESNDYRGILLAIVDALRPREQQEF